LGDIWSFAMRNNFYGIWDAVHLPFTITNELTEDIVNYCKEYAITPFTLLFSAYCLLLYRYSSQDDFCVGTPVANRRGIEEEKMVGFFANTLAIRVRPKPEQSFIDYVNTTEKIITESLKNQDIPLELIVNKLNIKRSSSHSPLFQYGFVLQNFEHTMTLADLEIELVGNVPDYSRFELMMVIEQTQDVMKGSIEYMTVLFDDRTIEQFVDNFRTLIKYSVQNPHVQITEIPLLPTDSQFAQHDSIEFRKENFDF
jgi:non-ribosomal peptide synthetase component F